MKCFVNMDGLSIIEDCAIHPISNRPEKRGGAAPHPAPKGCQLFAYDNIKPVNYRRRTHPRAATESRQPQSLPEGVVEIDTQRTVGSFDIISGCMCIKLVIQF